MARLESDPGPHGSTAVQTRVRPTQTRVRHDDSEGLECQWVIDNQWGLPPIEGRTPVQTTRVRTTGGTAGGQHNLTEWSTEGTARLESPGLAPTPSSGGWSTQFDRVVNLAPDGGPHGGGVACGKDKGR